MARPSQPSPIGPRRVLSAKSLLNTHSMEPIFSSREGGSKHRNPSTAKPSQVHGTLHTPLNMYQYEDQPTISSHSINGFSHHPTTSVNLPTTPDHPAHDGQSSVAMAVPYNHQRHQQLHRNVPDVVQSHSPHRHPDPYYGSPSVVAPHHHYDHHHHHHDDRAAVHQPRHHDPYPDPDLHPHHPHHRHHHYDSDVSPDSERHHRQTYRDRQHHHNHYDRHGSPDSQRRRHNYYDGSSVTSEIVPYTHDRDNHHYYDRDRRGEAGRYDNKGRYLNGHGPPVVYQGDRRGGARGGRRGQRKKWWQTEEKYELVRPSVAYIILKGIEVFMCVLIIIISRVGAGKLALDVVYTIFGFIGLVVAGVALLVLWIKGHPVPGYLPHTVMLLAFTITVPVLLCGAILCILEPDGNAYVGLTAALFFLAAALFTFDVVMMTVALLRCTCFCLEPPTLHRRRRGRGAPVGRSSRTYPINTNNNYPYDNRDRYPRESGRHPQYPYPRDDPHYSPEYPRRGDPRYDPNYYPTGRDGYAHRAALPPAHPSSRPRMNVGPGRTMRDPRRR
ncbi:uncharacterized protein [Littorina saxatilis]